MNDEQDKQNLPDDTHETRGKRPLPPPTPPPDEAETISLFDLMDDIDAPAENPTITLSRPPVSPDDAATLTDFSAPNAPQERPTYQPANLQPQERPLIDDLEATEVQPRLALPPEPTLAATTPPIQQTPPAKRPSTPPAATQQSAKPAAQPARQQPPPPVRPPARQAAPTPAQTPRVAVPSQEIRTEPVRRSPGRRNWSGCLLRGTLIMGALLIVGFFLTVAGLAFAYNSIASDLPSVADLENQVSSFETARIYDRDGNELFSLADPNTGNRTRVSLDQISPFLIQATIATEDSRFYENPGFDPVAIGRAIMQAAQEGEAVSGASTITQQLVRAVLLDEEERTDRTLRRKVREIILAAEMANTYDKDLILELYLNEIYYGNLAYGIEAAAQTYFNKSARDLTLAEASMLAGLPQAPAWWDPYTAPDKALGRQTEVLNLMLAEGYITREEALAAQNEAVSFVYNLTPPERVLKNPHFVFTVLQQAEALLGAQAIYRGGLRIHTTLDATAQQLAETTITNAQAAVNSAGANNAALVTLHPATGEILALVGSLDFFNEEIDGQVNMALAPRQPGSSIKPMVYLSAMEQGWTPSTLIWDVPTSFPNGANPPYQPKNYDDSFHGPLRLRPSLGNSYNIPAVKALEYVGVCNFIANMQKVGLTSLQDDGCAEIGQPRNYGLALALGGGEISPLEMAGSFAVLANQGRYNAPHSINRIEDRLGNVLYEFTPPDAATSQVVRPEHAYLLSDMLSDNGARQPAFGLNNPLVIAGHRVAAKTGTSGSDRTDVRDNWTIGYSPEVVTAVWVGNTDNSPIGGQSGVEVAAPIWNRFMSQYLAGRQPVDFVRPPGVVDVEICADSGTRPGIDCANRLVERFAGDQPPLDAAFDFIQATPVDLWTGYRANERCPEAVQEASFFTLLVNGRPEVIEREKFVAQQWLETTAGGQGWAQNRGIAIPLELPPAQSCDENTPRPQITISGPQPGSEVSGVVELFGTVNGPNFRGYQVEWGIGENPGGWGVVQERRDTPVENGVLATWDTQDVSAEGPITLRILLFGPPNPYNPEAGETVFEARIPLRLLTPTGTPTATPTETPTMTPTTTTMPTETPSLTPTTLPPVTIVPIETPTLPAATPTLPAATPTLPAATPTLPAATPTLPGDVLPTVTPTMLPEVTPTP
jgi:1A family penicillin-binding protein